METKLDTLILRNLVKSEDFTRQVLPYIKPSYFDEDHRIVFNKICEYVSTYNAMPTEDAIILDIESDNKITGPAYVPLCRTVFKGEADADSRWIMDRTEKWCQDQALGEALTKSIDIYQGVDTELDKGAIPSIMQDALGVCFDNSVGLDYTEDIERRYDYYTRKAVKIPFDLAIMNKVTKGGFEPKSLNVFMAGPGVGKSMAMCHFAADFLSQGRNVLYVTMEMSEEKIAQRIDANLMDVDIGDIEKMSKSAFMSAAKKITDKTKGRLIVREYPTSTANANHIRALLDDIRLKKQFKPEVIFIDYLNIMTSARLKGIGGAVNSYALIKAIAEEVRGLAVEFGVPIVTATQVNREGWGSSDVDLDNVSESFGLPATADFMMALIQNEELKVQNKMLCKQLKNRYNDLGYYNKFMIGVDRPKMRLYDSDDDDAEEDDNDCPIPVMDTGGSFDVTKYMDN